MRLLRHDRVSTTTLRLVECGIRHLHQRRSIQVLVPTRAVHGRNANGGGETPWHILPCDQRANALGQRDSGRFGGVRREDGEFVPAPASAGICCSQLDADGIGDMTECDIPSAMAKAVVDRLHAIEVHD